MAVDQDRVAEAAGGAVHELAQHPVIGLVEPLDPRAAPRRPEAAAIDLLAVGDDAGDGAEPAGDAHRARVGEGRQPALEHARVELVGLAVDVEIGAREARRHQRRAERRPRRRRARRRRRPPSAAGPCASRREPSGRRPGRRPRHGATLKTKGTVCARRLRDDEGWLESRRRWLAACGCRASGGKRRSRNRANVAAAAASVHRMSSESAVAFTPYVYPELRLNEG